MQLFTIPEKWTRSEGTTLTLYSNKYSLAPFIFTFADDFFFSFLKNVAAEKLAAEANGKAKAAEKRCTDLETKLENTIKSCRSDRRKAVEEMEVIQLRCDQTMQELKADTQKQLEYSRKEYEEIKKSIEEEAEKRVKEIEENAMQDARVAALDKIQEAQSETAKAEAEVQDLHKELEKLTEEKSEILDQLNHINTKNEREKYVLYEKIEYMDKQYQERMTQQENMIRNEMQDMHEKHFKEILHELEWEKQKLLLYKKSAEDEKEDNKRLLQEIKTIQDENAFHQQALYESMEAFREEALGKQKQMESEVQALNEEAISFMSSLLRPTSPNLEQPNVQRLYKKVQKLKASFTYLKFRSMGRMQQNDENVRLNPVTSSTTPVPAPAPTTSEAAVEEGEEDTLRIPVEKPSYVRRAPSRRKERTDKGEVKKTSPPKSATKAAFNPSDSPYQGAIQNKETFTRRSQSARPSRTEISALTPSKTILPNFSNLKPLKSVGELPNLGMLGLPVSGGKSDFILKDFKKIERKKSGRSTLKLV